MKKLFGYRIGRIATFFVAMAVIPACLFAGGAGEQGGGAEGPAPVRYAVPGSVPDDQDIIVDAINEQMAASGVGVELQIENIAWDVWDSKTNVMLAGGEPLELIHMMEDIRSFQSYQSEGVLLAITDVLQEHGPNIREIVPEAAWEAVTLDGDIYTVPAIWADHANGKYMITLRTDILEATGLDMPTTREELIEAGIAMQAEFEDRYGQTVYSWYHNVDTRQDSLVLTMDRWPFWIDPATQAFIVYQDDASVAAFPLSSEFEQMARFNREMYEAGLIHPDVLTVPRDNISDWKQNGEWVYAFMTYVMQNMSTMQSRYPEVGLEMFRLNPDNKPILAYEMFYNSNGVPYTAENPEAGIKFLNWMWAEPDNHDLVLHGIEGVHFNRLGENRIESLVAPDRSVGTGIEFWMAGLMQWRKFDAAVPEQIVQLQTGQRDPDVTILPSVTLGFKFNPEPVRSAYVNVSDVISSDFTPIIYGVVDYDEAIDAAREKLESAGIAEVVEEYRRQFEAWQNR